MSDINLTQNQGMIAPGRSKTFKNWVFWIIIALIVVVLAVAYLFSDKLLKYWGQNETETPKVLVYDVLPQGYKYVASPAGELPEGFPKDLVLDKKALIIRGETTTDGTGSDHKIAEFYSSSTPSQIIGSYSSALPKKEWLLDYSIDNGEAKIAKFSKSSATLQITTVPYGLGSQVVLDYIFLK